MKSAVTSPCEHLRNSGTRNVQLNFDGSSSSRLRSGTLGTIGSSPTTSLVNATVRCGADDSPSTSCVARNTRAISIDLSINSILNDSQKNTCPEPFTRSGRNLPVGVISGDRDFPLSLVKICPLPVESDRKENLIHNSANTNEETESSCTLPKRLQRLSVSIPGIIDKCDGDRMHMRNSMNHDLAAKFITPTKPRGARFVEVEVQKVNYSNFETISALSNDNISNRNPYNATNTACKSNFESNNFNVIIRDETVAFKNDKILRDKFSEAKSLNRKNETGAIMHTFSLWGKTNDSTEVVSLGTANSNIEVNRSSPGDATSDVAATGKGSSEIQYSISIPSSRSYAQPKHIVKSPNRIRSPKHQSSKLRGPLAARGKHEVVRQIISGHLFVRHLFPLILILHILQVCI